MKRLKSCVDIKVILSINFVLSTDFCFPDSTQLVKMSKLTYYQKSKLQAERDRILGHGWADDSDEEPIGKTPRIGSVGDSETGLQGGSIRGEGSGEGDGFDVDVEVDGSQWQEQSHEDPHDAPRDKESFDDMIREYAMRFKVSHVQLSYLLAKVGPYLQFPISKCSKTVLKLPVKPPRPVSMAPGSYIHCGLEMALNVLPDSVTELDKISLDIFFDGFPLFASPVLECWPILAHIVGSDIRPLCVGVYIGPAQPKDSNEYTRAFVEEMLRIDNQNVLVSPLQKKMAVEIRMIACDTKARTFITCTHGFNKLVSGCNKCIQVSHTRARSSTAVFSPIRAELRTDNSYAQRVHENLHLPGYKTPGSVLLESLPLGMVSKFPIDPMHSVDLGVAKRILRLLIQRKIFGAPINKTTLQIMSSDFSSYSKHTPSEFQRKPRDLFSCGNFKATECRQFLLYTGMVLFKKYFSEDLYIHYLNLSIAYRLLNAPFDEVILEQADDLLKLFVSNYHLYYTEEQLVYNVHSLLHLVDDCRLYGPVYEFNSYKFENELSSIRGMVRSKNRVLEQIFNRCTENLVYNPEYYHVNRNRLFKIVPNDRDSYFLLKNDCIVRIEGSANSSGSYKARVIYQVRDLFKLPVRSAVLGIHVCKLGSAIVNITRNSIKCKLYRIDLMDSLDSLDEADLNEIGEEVEGQSTNLDEEFVVIPLLHS